MLVHINSVQLVSDGLSLPFFVQLLRLFAAEKLKLIISVGF